MKRISIKQWWRKTRREWALREPKNRYLEVIDIVFHEYDWDKASGGGGIILLKDPLFESSIYVPFDEEHDASGIRLFLNVGDRFVYTGITRYGVPIFKRDDDGILLVKPVKSIHLSSIDDIEELIRLNIRGYFLIDYVFLSVEHHDFIDGGSIFFEPSPWVEVELYLTKYCLEDMGFEFPIYDTEFVDMIDHIHISEEGIKLVKLFENEYPFVRHEMDLPGIFVNRLSEAPFVKIRI